MSHQLKLLQAEQHHLRSRIADLKMKRDSSPEYMAFLKRLDAAITGYIRMAEQDLIPKIAQLTILLAEADYNKDKQPDNKYLMEVIKKQALIIEAAGIQYPTINQSLGHIHDIALIARGHYHLAGTNHPVTVNIEVI